MQVLSVSQRTGQFPSWHSSVHVQPAGQVHCPLLQLSSQHARLSQLSQVVAHAPPKPPIPVDPPSPVVEPPPPVAEPPPDVVDELPPAPPCAPPPADALPDVVVVPVPAPAPPVPARLAFVPSESSTQLAGPTMATVAASVAVSNRAPAVLVGSEAIGASYHKDNLPSPP